MSKNILLINPPVYDFSYFDLWAKPLGILSIAGLLEECGYKVSFIDCLDKYHPDIQKIHKVKVNNYGVGKFYSIKTEKPDVIKHIPRNFKRFGYPKSLFINELKNQRPDAILVTSIMTYWYPGVFEVTNIVKEIFPKVPVILGGIYATLCYEHAKKRAHCDYIIKGEGEIEGLKLLDNIFSQKRNYSKYENIDNLPYPLWKLVRKNDYICILTSRGCPYRCTYCATYEIMKKFRQRNFVKVVDEIEFYIRNFGVKNFTFYDDALFFNPENHIVRILEEIVKRKIKVYFHTPNGLNAKLIDEKLAKLMFQSGFKTIRLGFETSNELLQKNTGSKITNEEFLSGIFNLKSAGYKQEEIGVYILVGIPGQKIEDVIETISFVVKAGGKPIITEYSPIPGTSDFENSKSEFIFNPEIDPILQNNSLLPFQSKIFTPDIFQAIKDSSKLLATGN